MGRALSSLIDNIDLEKIDINIFRGKTIDDARDYVYGGQVLAQAINAASRTVARPLVLHSLHAYLLREGDEDSPIIYEVDRIRDGRSFTTRRVVAIQHGRAIFNVSLSYQLPEEALVEHGSPMPKVVGPEDLINDEILAMELYGEARQKAWPVEYRQVDPVNPNNPEVKPANTCVWFRSNGALADDYAMHQELLAYASDYLLLQTALRPHGMHADEAALQVASLDHSLWFHRPFRVDEWLLYEIESTAAAGARAFCRGRVFNVDGDLVASTAQEGLIRNSR
ncbi:Acyl-CoA thioesterase 2 [BD1-7 clade bacterium]|uniref:Acyl-CoA thioesterase 2 n=1 Tax=BD1-7 clade bacterium TaxID=2029982 RepID=A0A5S9QXX7_9GAMM|nr:Acyl-CoA thioesterase 2 [BD1-7 clade bacterium]CAA0109008.1 Acyl-CoA thioesterase 2 [BD1-7 clade bacterium]CAA0124280.1 Acyl-CoA thioesterase 2 [BD1-7 clade bacterium]